MDKKFVVDAVDFQREGFEASELPEECWILRE